MREVLRLLGGNAAILLKADDPPATVALLIIDDLLNLGELDKMMEALEIYQAREMDLLSLLSEYTKAALIDFEII